MGSVSDWPTMRRAAEVLEELGVLHEPRVLSAHRTPGDLAEYGAAAEARGFAAIVAGAGGAAHLPGMLAAQTLVPVFGVPVATTGLLGMDALLSIVQMPEGIPVGTLAIGAAGAANAALLAAAVIAVSDPALRERLRARREAKAAAVRACPDPRSAPLPSAARPEAGRPS